MSTHAEELSQRDRELGEVLFACLQTQEAGRPLDPAAVLARYPQFTTELTDFFADRSRVERLAAPLRELVQAVSSVTGDLDTAPRGVDSPLPPDVTGFGDYELLGEIGRGGMGVVFRARQKSLGRVVALKMLGQNAFADPRDLDRFRGEAELAATLDHPGIVPIYDVGTWRANEASPPVPYFTMKLLEAGTLAQAVRSQPSAFSHAEIAQLVAQVADAVHHAHQRGILHRDLKPSNILLQGEGTADARGCTQMKDKEQAISQHDPVTPSASGSSICVHLRSSAVPIIPIVADFGLAKRLPREGEAGAELTQSGALVGTPSYMAPEQVSGERAAITTATDVYGLGAILYALLTGRPPHQGADQLDTLLAVRTREPEPPSRVRPGVPRDLETICIKALAREPARRYGSAAELAADLRRWLAGEPIEARPAGRAEKAWRWCRRNPGMAGLAAAVVVLMVGTTVASAWAAYSASEREQEQRHRTLLEQLQVIRFSPHDIGWSGRAMNLAADAARIRRTHLTQSLAAATLRGLDAVPRKHFENKSASSLVFNRRGDKLLLGGIYQHGQTPAEAARLWYMDTGEFELVSPHVAPGPVGFLGDIPVQLVPREGPELLLWDISNKQPLRTFRLNLPSDGAKGWRWFGGDARSHPTGPLIVMTPDATRIAAAAIGPDRKGVVTVWNGATGKTLATFERPVQALALSADGNYVAGGDSIGGITVWPLDGGEPTTIRATRLEVLCLAFRSDGRVLAVGDSGGTITSWEWRSQQRQMTYSGSPHHVFQLVYSPDGTLLASGGRRHARLWDATTGALVLEGTNENMADYMCALAFSPDGRHLAHASRQAHYPANVRVYELQEGRGIRTLRGLSSPVQQVVFSPDGALVGAISHNWQAGLWDSATGRLTRVLDIPRGEHVDNCALAISQDNRRVAVASLDRAVLWDLNDGKEQSWKLPPGLCNALIFHPDGPLLLLRAESRDGKERPYGPYREDNPRVCQLRNLLEPDEKKQRIATIGEFNRHLDAVHAAPDGNTFLITGVHDGSDGKYRTLRAYDARTGMERWSKGPWTDLDQRCWFYFEPSGKSVFAVPNAASEEGDLLELTTGKVLSRLRGNYGMSPGAKYLLSVEPTTNGRHPRGRSLVKRGDSTPLLVLGIEGGRDPFLGGDFSPDGTLVTRGNSDGTVTLISLPEVQRGLTAIGLGW